jgi:hypothetical protein
VWVAVGAGTNTIATSSDGIAWTGLGTSVFDVAGRSVDWNGVRWVAVGEGSVNTIAYATSAASSWTGVGNSVFSVRGVSVKWMFNRWVAGGEGTNTMASSVNGTSWTGLGSSVSCVDLDWNGYLAIAATGDGFAHSADGLTWSVDSSGNVVSGVKWAGNKWVASGDVVRISGDGANWSTISSIASGCVGAMAKFGAVEPVCAIPLKVGEKLTIVSPSTYDVSLVPDTMISLALNLM